MRRFDRKGMLIWPVVAELSNSTEKKSELLVVEHSYCPNGHNMISARVKFNNFSGILLKVKKGTEAGLMGLSPVIGDKSRITIDIDIEDGQIKDFFCPECDVKLPVYSPCKCGAELISLFLHPNANFADCVGVCNRFGCKYSEVRSGDDLIHSSGAETW